MGNARLLTGRQTIVRWLRNGVAVLLGMAALGYFVDWAVLRYRVAASKEPFGTVTIRPIYSVPQKNHRVEYLPGDPMDQACVNALFPHNGDVPCWYLRRHKEQRIDM